MESRINRVLARDWKIDWVNKHWPRRSPVRNTNPRLLILKILDKCEYERFDILCIKVEILSNCGLGHNPRDKQKIRRHLQALVKKGNVRQWKQTSNNHTFTVYRLRKRR